MTENQEENKKEQENSNQSKPETSQLKGNSNSIFVGGKPIKNYLSSINLQLNKDNQKEIILKARGKFIARAVDIAELAKRSEDFNLDVTDIIINTEEYTKEDKKVKVSTIEIKLVRK